MLIKSIINFRIISIRLPNINLTLSQGRYMFSSSDWNYFPFSFATSWPTFKPHHRPYLVHEDNPSSTVYLDSVSYFLQMSTTHSVQFSRSVVSDSLRSYELQHARSLSIINCQSLLNPMSIESVMPSNHPILCRPLLLLP